MKTRLTWANGETRIYDCAERTAHHMYASSPLCAYEPHLHSSVVASAGWGVVLQGRMRVRLWTPTLLKKAKPRVPPTFSSLSLLPLFHFEHIAIRERASIIPNVTENRGGLRGDMCNVILASICEIPTLSRISISVCSIKEVERNKLSHYTLKRIIKR